MKPFQLLVTILASMLIISVILIILNDDVITKEFVYEPDSYMSIRDVDVEPVEVTSAKIRLNVTAYINHDSGQTRNASMLIRAISSDTGLLETLVSAQIPDAPAPEKIKTIPVSQELTVDRNGGYELKLLIFNNGSIKDSGSINIRGLGAMTPGSKHSGITLTGIDFTVSGTSAGNVDVVSDIYLENRGPEPSENLEMVIKAREGTSNLLADKTTSKTGVIASETTVVKTVKLTVPDNYNYLVVVELWKGNVLVNEWEKPVLLAPTKTIPKESVEKAVNIDISKFVREDTMYPPVRPEEIPYYGEPQAPGFGILTGIIAIASVLFFFRRRL